MNAVEQFRDALSHIPADDRDTWVRMGMAVKSELGDAGFELWNTWSQRSESYNPHDARDVWKSISQTGTVTAGTLFHEARANGWRDDGTYRKPTAEELAERRREAAERAAQEQAAIARERAEAAKKAAAIRKAATPASADNPYLTRKHISSVATLLEIDASAAAAILGYAPKSDGKLLKGRLLIAPVMIGDKLSTVEFIDETGQKSALYGGTKAGGYWAAQPLPDGDGTALRLLIGEGVATVLSGKEARGHPSIAALSAGNLSAVAKAMRERYPAAELVILADLVKATGKPDQHAVDAALAVGGLLAVPDFSANRPEGASDFNDMAQHRGPEAVKEAIANAKPPARGEPHTEQLDKEAVEKLAKLSPFDYDRARDAEAVRLKVRVSSLDVEVRKARGETAEDHGQGQAFAIESPEPWPGPVNAVELLDDIAAAFRRYVILPDHADVALALWTMHTYSYDCGRCTPILALTSPQKRCGKTTLMSVLLSLANKPLAASNISPSCVFRSIDRWQPTLLIDEADSFIKDNEELRGIINSGHTRELAFVIRNVGDEHEPRRFSTWCPKALALIGKLPPTLHDRAIEIPLVRKTSCEVVSRLTGFDGVDIRRRCARWSSDNAQAISIADPVVPPELHDRAADNWRPLLAIADLVDGEWPQRVRTAVKALAEGDDDTESYAVMLLADIRDLFEQRQVDKLFSEDIVEHLHTLEDRPWPQWGRAQKPITKNHVARLLKPFKIKPATKREGGTTSKGYELKHFKEAFSRYLPPIQTVTPSQPKQDAASQDFQTVTPKNNVTDENPPKPAPDMECDGVTDGKGGTGETEAWSTRI